MCAALCPKIIKILQHVIFSWENVIRDINFFVQVTTKRFIVQSSFSWLLETTLSPHYAGDDLWSVNHEIQQHGRRDRCFARQPSSLESLAIHEKSHGRGSEEGWRGLARVRTTTRSNCTLAWGDILFLACRAPWHAKSMGRSWKEGRRRWIVSC